SPATLSLYQTRSNSRLLRQHHFDFSQFHPIPAHLDLAIHTSHIFQLSISPVTAQIPRAIEPTPRLDRGCRLLRRRRRSRALRRSCPYKGIGQETFCRQIPLIQIPPCHSNAPNIDFSCHSH